MKKLRFLFSDKLLGSEIGIIFNSDNTAKTIIFQDIVEN